MKHKARKGLSPLVATVLLIALSVTIAAIVLNWSSFFATVQTDDITNTSNVIKDCAVLSIDSVYLDFTTNISRVYVKSSLEGVMDSVKLITVNGIDMPLITQMPLGIDKGDIKRI